MIDDAYDYFIEDNEDDDDENIYQGRVDCTTMDWPSLVVSKTRTRS